MANQEKDKKRRLAVFLDGTWNVTGDNTNVWRLKALCSPIGDDGCLQSVYYEPGVNGFWGGTFGKGLSENVVAAYEWLVGEYNPGDEIFIFGFSRGAYTARSLAGFIAKYGLLKPGAPLGVGQMYERYRRANDRTIRALLEQDKAGTIGKATLEERWMVKFARPIPIKLVGVWDTVGALGVPAFSIEGISRSTLGFLHTGLRIPIENGYHALAIDEHRKSFAPTLWTVKQSTVAKPRDISSVEQRWFAGAHANVGGGYRSDLLAQPPLRWIMRKATQLGLSFRYDVELDGEVLKAPIADSYKDFMRGAYYRVSKPLYRTISAPPQTDAEGTSTTVNETIDTSVFDRWRSVSEYRPANLVDWASRRGIDPTKITSSVQADASMRPVSD
jgi:uncharacterized protein (DUF2235 family)